MANSAPPAADFKKPATPSPTKAGAEGEKSKTAGASTKPPGGEKDTRKTPPAQSGRETTKNPGGPAGADKAAGQQRFDQMAVRAKLAVSEPGDAIERQADAVADRVLRMPEPAGAPSKKPATPSGKPDDIRRKEAPSSDDSRRRDSASEDTDRPVTTQALIARLGAGEPLDAETRSYFEKRMSCDLAHVRIHADTGAAQSAAQIRARAFTYGSHIAFASGEYQPQSESGKRLLAHELVHVLQQSDGSISRMIMRQTSAAGASGSTFPVTRAELEVPPIKARHLGGYSALSGQELLRRQGAYDASTRGTKQVGLWTGGVKPDVNKIPEDRRPSASTGFNLTLNVAGGAATKVVKAGSADELAKLLQIPTWSATGEEKQFQVDHMVEYQLGGADALGNMELLDQAHNGSVGSSFSHGIKRTVREEIQADPANPALAGYTGPRNASGEPTAEGVMQAMTVVFKKVKGRARESARKEGGSMFWTKEQIEALDHVLSMLGASKGLEGTATSFALLSPTGNLLIAQLPHGNAQNTITIAGAQAGGMAGFKMKRLVLNDGYNDTSAGTNIGTLEGVLDFGPAVAIPEADMKVGVSQAQSPGKYSGKVGSATGAGLPNQVEFKPMSPLLLNEITFGQGVFGKATLQPTHPALSGVSIPATIQNGRLGLFYTIDATQLAERIKIPGLVIDSAGITLGYDGTDFSVGGGAEFTIKKFGTGFLNASIDTAKNFELNGGFRADTRLFDQADMKLWYRSKGGFGGAGTLAITKPGKIKGLKSARLSAKYEDSVFTATGDVIPDIPGLKAASLSVKYENDTLEITGKVSIDNKVPGVEKADITVMVTQGEAGWKVGASGQVTPKLPGLSGAQLAFSYDDGSVLLEGEFTIKKGPLDGTVKAGVTNAEVDEKGVRAGKGSGNVFKVFGAADINATLIKDKLDGKLRLRLLPDGSTRVGGDLTARDFEVFPQYPKDGGEFFRHTFSTPPVPVPGLGFAVGSVSVGITFSASITAKARASIGPGKLSGITVGVKEFNPASVNLDTLEFRGGARFDVFADAGFGASAQINLIFGAAIAELVGSVGVEATVGIPPDLPIISAQSQFTYSQANGLDLTNTLKLSINPALKFRLFGQVAARLNIVVDTITVWSKDFTLAEANYKLPVSLNASGTLGYNSKTGRITPANPKDAITVEQPKLDGDVMKDVVMGQSAPPSIQTTDKRGKVLTDEELLMCTAAPQASQSISSPEPNQSVMPRRQPGAAGPTPAAVDESVIERLGTGVPLDLSTRGFFEQRMKGDLSQVLIHTGPAAGREADRLQAEAFTVGNHIAFALGTYQPATPDGQELIAHELAHVVQQRDGTGEPIVMRWPAVTRTTARTAETPASIRARTLSDFVLLTRTQLDWATSPPIQADAGALATFRDLQTFADGPHILEACGDLGVGDLIAKGVPGVYPALRKYTEGVTSRATAWLRRTNDTNKAERWGSELATLEGVWPAANLSLVMRAPDPVTNPSPFERLEDPASPELPNFISYLAACTPVLSASNGREIDSFLRLRAEGALPQSYRATVSHVSNYHHFTKGTLDGLVTNEAFPQWRQRMRPFQRPLTVVLYPAVDHNGAFHRNAGLEAMVTNSAILTIVVEGLASVADYQSQLAPVAARYGINGEIQQAMIGGHGNANILVLAGTAGGAVASDSLGTAGPAGTATTNLIAELTRLMSGDPTKRRIVLDACLTNSHHVATALRASPADAAADVHAAILANPSLRDVVARAAGPGSNVFGANASFAPAQTTFMTPGSRAIGLSVPGDPDLIASKLEYVEFGTEPEGCMRAVLECWADDQLAGTHRCRDAILRRLAGGRSAHVPAAGASTWRESIIQPLYDLAANHYWGNGDAIRLLSRLAGQAFELFWPDHVTASSLEASLAPLGGNAAQIGLLFTRMSGEPHYAATPRVAVVIEQVWMQYTPARLTQFMAALGRYSTCLTASADVEMGKVMAHVPAALVIPPPVPPPADQLRLALMAAHHAPVGVRPPLPLPAATGFLRSLLGAGPTFPAALGISAALGGLASEDDILADIGRPISGPPDPRGPAPAANIDPIRDAAALNDFRVSPLRRRGVVSTARGDLNVRSTPTTGTDRNIFNRLAPAAPVIVIGEWAVWYAIEQASRSGFVAKRYISLLP